jgi:predicted translin family RNA/ssDNA-binding protein
MQNEIFDISQKLQNGQISLEEAEKLTNELEEKYSELTENSIEDSLKQAKEQFEKINKNLISLPDWAKKL